ncbi:hypothetical protein LTR62_003547 [Meristemomyces frigidus]|uniref:Transcription factor BYE1 n=1 Tax=Meristemomyces frigidus TaxID=1508187 RepID=A0AAN7TKS5_9PEZI|nr:hypothetical protein LTR62_003547 [Meristemomyces frigidus]
MSEEPRRSVRATKGQHTKASSSPAPQTKQKPTKGSAKSKSKKKQDDEEDAGDEDAIRCICGNDDPDDKRPFIGCDACSVWQHNICMGMPEDDSEVPEHYFCEVCKPDEHVETLAALANGDRIWETRTSKYKAWKKMSASRRKSKGKGSDDARPPWLKDDGVAAEVDGGEAVNGSAEQSAAEEGGVKRKRDSVKIETAVLEDEGDSEPVSRRDKRRKSSQVPSKSILDAETAIIDIDKLPADRKKIAQALSKIISEDIQERSKSGYRLSEAHTPSSLGARLASLIEYELYQVHSGAHKEQKEKYAQQFRNLNANLKRNKVLIERLLDGSLRAGDLATMESKDMASEELQREMKQMKEEADRQAVLVEAEGPRYKQDHKGLERIEDERADGGDGAAVAQPVRERASVDEGGAGSPVTTGVNVDGGARSPLPASMAGSGQRSFHAHDRRESSQQNFDMKEIWQKTGASAASPTTATGPRPMQMAPRRGSSVQLHQTQDTTGATKVDADVDRLLQDEEEEEEEDTYSPHASLADDTILWRGILAHTGEGEPVVNARYAAGRDLTKENSTTWSTILPPKLTVDGRLAVAKAEEYLCGLQWSQNSDVSVLALTPYDNKAAFDRVFEYFSSRGRYAVVNGDKPGLARDLYIIPVERGAGLPEHVGMLQDCSLRSPVEERVLLATFVIMRAAVVPGVAVAGEGRTVGGNGGGQQGLPQHMRAGTGGAGPASSPLASTAPTFSPSHSLQSQQPASGYGASNPQSSSPFPPNPYDQQAQAQTQTPNSYLPPSHPNNTNISVLAAEILGPRQYDPTAQQILAANPGPDELRNLRKILDEDVEARTDIQALGRKLMGGQ